MSMRNGVRLFTSACLLLLCSLTVLAQSQTTGRIVGTVTDEKGAALPGAEVTVTNKATGEVRSVVADDSGHYIAPLLPPGDYSVSVAANGFKKFIADDVRVALTETTTLDSSLVIGAVSESVSVSVAPQLVQTEGAQLGRVVDTRAVSELPLATRNFTQILGLSAGAATYLPDNTSVGRNSQNISVNGARVTNNNFQINGIDANSMGTNSAPSLAVPAPETIQEFKVQTSLYDATFGRSGGGNIQAVTKSGGNDFHGGGYGYFRNARFNANNPFLNAAGVARPVLTRNVFGGFLGGPIKKDKLFFFGSYQGTRERNGASIINSLSSNVLIAPGLTDNRSEAVLLATFRPVTLTGVPATSINPTALALLNARLASGQFLIPTPTSTNGTYTGSTPSVFDENQINANIDYRYNDKNTFAFKFFSSNAPQTLVLPSFLGGGPNVPGYGNFQQNNNRLLTMQFVHIFSPNVFNELRAGYNFIRVDAFPEEPINDSDVGINRSNANLFPGLGLIRINAGAGGVVFGTSATIDVKATAPSTTIADTVSITKAMAVVMGATYPDVFFGVGVMAGLAFKAGTTVETGLAAMKQGGPDPKQLGLLAFKAMGDNVRGKSIRRMPVIVFHGDTDPYLSPLNAGQVIAQWAKTNDFLDDGQDNDSVKAEAVETIEGSVPAGHGYTRYVYNDGSGRLLMEKWIVKGLGHAWSGSPSAAPLADPKGPGASKEMWRFFGETSLDTPRITSHR